MADLYIRGADGAVHTLRTVAEGDGSLRIEVSPVSGSVGVVQESLPSDFDTLKITVGTTALVLSATSRPVKGTAFLKLHPTMLGTVAIGKDNAVTIATGFPFVAGDLIPLPIDDLNKVWLVASTTLQDVYVLYGKP